MPKLLPVSGGVLTKFASCYAPTKARFTNTRIAHQDDPGSCVPEFFYCAAIV